MSAEVERDHPAGDRVDRVSATAALFHGLSDPSRLTILRHLRLGPHRVVDLTAHLGLSQSTVSKHLACLRDTGLVTMRPEGRASMYSLAHADALDELLVVAERLLRTEEEEESRRGKHVGPSGSHRDEPDALRLDGKTRRPA